MYYKGKDWNADTTLFAGLFVSNVYLQLAFINGTLRLWLLSLNTKEVRRLGVR